MSDCVVDASAVLAVLNGEPGYQQVLAWLERGACHISAVNVVEVLSRLVDWGVPQERAVSALAALELSVHPLDEMLARECAALRPATRALGLSLGDRACLALACKLGVPALTADRSWLRVELGIAVDCIRPEP